MGADELRTTNHHDRLTSAEFDGPKGTVAVIYLDGEPILYAEFCGRWRCSYAINYVERQPGLSAELYENLHLAESLSLSGMLREIAKLLALFCNE